MAWLLLPMLLLEFLFILSSFPLLFLHPHSFIQATCYVSNSTNLLKQKINKKFAKYFTSIKKINSICQQHSESIFLPSIHMHTKNCGHRRNFSDVHFSFAHWIFYFFISQSFFFNKIFSTKIRGYLVQKKWLRTINIAWKIIWMCFLHFLLVLSMLKFHRHVRGVWISIRYAEHAE